MVRTSQEEKSVAETIKPSMAKVKRRKQENYLKEFVDDKLKLEASLDVLRTEFCQRKKVSIAMRDHLKMANAHRNQKIPEFTIRHLSQQKNPVV